MSKEDEASVIRSQLRMPEDLHKAIVNAAKASHRTMNGEIVYRLSQCYETLELSRKLDFIISMLRANDPDAYKRFYLQELERGSREIDRPT